jgi:hypothetical protein
MWGEKKNITEVQIHVSLATLFVWVSNVLPFHLSIKNIIKKPIFDYILILFINGNLKVIHKM